MQIVLWLSVFFAGVIGSMGMGGGTILIPALALFSTMSQHMSQAINLIAFVPLAIVSLIIHFKNKLVEFKPALFCAIFSAVAGFGASFFAQKISGEVLRKILGGFLIVLAIVAFINIFKKKETNKLCACRAAIKNRSNKTNTSDNVNKNETNTSNTSNKTNTSDNVNKNETNTSNTSTKK